MRYALSRLSAALLLSATLPVGLAAAQSPGQPGWVDPPAKAAAPAPKPDANPTPAPSAAEAPKSAQAETLPARRSAERPARRREAVRRSLRRASGASATREIVPAARSAAVAPASDARLVEWAGAAQGLARDYLDSVSAPGPAMLASTPRFYAERVRFHGRSMTLAALTAEKRRFVQRWPERRYEPRAGTMQTACSASLALCRVETAFDFRAENPAKGLRAQGVSTVTFEVSFAGGRPVIVSETSRVLRRDGPVSALAASRRPV